MGKILVVDDSRTDRTLIRKILKTRDYQIIEYEQGSSLTEKVKKESPDLILLDIIMPDVSGYEVCRKLKKSTETNKIPVIFISARKQTSDIYWGKLQGADEYLPKPFEPKDLLQVVSRFMEKN